jgi:hypothetical protein
MKLASFSLALLLLVGCQPVSEPLAVDTDIVARFNEAVAASVQKSHTDTMLELQEQRSILDRISASISELQEKTKASEVKPIVKSETNPPTVEIKAESNVVRMPGSSWNVEGNWNYTLVELADHLRRVHGVNVDGKTMAELRTMHDNLHNGYSAYGAPAKPAVQAPVQYYMPAKQSQPTFRRYRTYSTCPTGTNCPQ